MKKLINVIFKSIYFSIVLVPMLFFGQTTTENYIKTTNYKKATTAGSVNTSNPTDATVSVTYFDGLGRPVQQIAHKQSGTGNDLVTYIKYDDFGRQVKEYLPIVNGQTLNYHSVDESSVLSYYSTPAIPTIETTANPYSEKLFESSPLNRVLKQAAPGNDWQMGNGHEIKFDYQTNATIDSVKLYKAITTWKPEFGHYDISLVEDGRYDANQLYRVVTKNENWVSGNLNTTHEFKDKEGNIILKRNYEYNTKGVIAPLDTYYVYDIYGNLTFVIPPAIFDVSNPNMIEEFCYQYKYDSHNRLVEKKLPGKQWEFMVYDKLDRLVMNGPVRTPFLHLNNDGWMFTKYDDFNRPIITGWMTSGNITSEERKDKQDERDSQTVFSENRLSSGTSPAAAPTSAKNPINSYSNVVLPTTGYILTINYYDDYLYVDAPTSFADVETQPVYYNNTEKPKGLATGKWTKVLELTGSQASTKKETSYVLYDYKARPIQNRVNNHEGGWTQIDTKLDFEGKTEYKVTSHRRTASPGTNGIVTSTEYFTYSDQSRLLLHTQKINSGSVQLIAENSYDDLGQLISKKVGNTTTTPLQKVDYAYNIRGWLKGINNDPTDNLVLNTSENDLFSFKINYNNVQNSINYIGKKLYNGNISETYWRSASDNELRKYGYHYDNLSRLTNAAYLKPENAEPDPGTYNEQLTYDPNGNILTLNRWGGPDGIMPEQKIDQLTYFYANNGKSNKLIKVTDAANAASGFIDGVNTGDDYSYDSYGNMVMDENKGISNIRYNHLNLPMEITFVGSADKISYVYNGEGKKIEKKVTQGTTETTTKYLEGFQYKKINGATDVLQFFPTAEGYVKKTGTSNYNYVFNHKDHLGNIRLSYQDLDNNGTIATSEIIEENHYYPFGLKHSYNSSAVGDYKYKYNGKEYQDELGLNMYDYGARNYDPALGRLMNIDPKANLLPFASPYTYCLNNPILMIDPDGQYPWSVHVRSFISTPTTGGGLFYGDGRGASFTGTSRVRSTFVVDPSKGVVSQPVTKSDPTVFFGIPGKTKPVAKTGTPRGSNDNIDFSENTASFDFSHSGKDPITPQWATPELDVHAELSFNEDLKNGVLSITGSFTGDKFPSTEAFITDQSGKTKLFLGAKKEKGDVSDLYGDNTENLFKVNIQIKFDDKGNFTGVQQGKTTYSVEDWNKKVQEGFKK